MGKLLICFYGSRETRDESEPFYTRRRPEGMRARGDRLCLSLPSTGGEHWPAKGMGGEVSLRDWGGADLVELLALRDILLFFGKRSVYLWKGVVGGFGVLKYLWNCQNKSPTSQRFSLNGNSGYHWESLSVACYRNMIYSWFIYVYWLNIMIFYFALKLSKIHLIY